MTIAVWVCCPKCKHRFVAGNRGDYAGLLCKARVAAGLTQLQLGALLAGKDGSQEEAERYQRLLSRLESGRAVSRDRAPMGDLLARLLAEPRLRDIPLDRSRIGDRREPTGCAQWGGDGHALAAWQARTQISWTALGKLAAERLGGSAEHWRKLISGITDGDRDRKRSQEKFLRLMDLEYPGWRNAPSVSRPDCAQKLPRLDLTESPKPKGKPISGFPIGVTRCRPTQGCHESESVENHGRQEPGRNLKKGLAS